MSPPSSQLCSAFHLCISDLFPEQVHPLLERQSSLPRSRRGPAAQANSHRAAVPSHHERAKIDALPGRQLQEATGSVPRGASQSRQADERPARITGCAAGATNSRATASSHQHPKCTLHQRRHRQAPAAGPQEWIGGGGAELQEVAGGDGWVDDGGAEQPDSTGCTGQCAETAAAECEFQYVAADAAPAVLERMVGLKRSALRRFGQNKASMFGI